MTSLGYTQHDLLRSLLSRLPNRLVLDVGAEKGDFVDACLAAGSTQVFAFEPYPPRAADLRKKYTDVPAVTVLDAAIGTADKPIRLRVAHDASGQPLDFPHSFADYGDRRDARWFSEIDVVCRSLDSLAADAVIPRAVGLLRVDADRANLLVLQGATSIESAVVAVACWNGLQDTMRDPPYDVSELADVLSNRGYRDLVFVRRRDGIECLQVGSAHLHDGDSGTLVFIHETVRAHLMPVVYEASAAAVDRLMDLAVSIRQENQEQRAVIDSLQGAVKGGRLDHAAPEPWVEPSSAGEAERLRSRRARVSVITPSFNQARFLEQTMRSVLDQGYPNLEYIVIDGGSTDGSVDIIRRHADRLAFWTSEPDRGQANAINKGMARVTGDIVAWVNSDDFYYPGAIQAAADAFAADPALGFVYGRGNRVNERGELIEPFAYTRPFDLRALTHGIDYILQPTVFLRRGALAEVAPLDPALHWTLDWDLWIRLGRNFPARMLDHMTAASREYASTKTSSGGFERMEEIRRITAGHTGRAMSIGYLNYLMFTLLDALPGSGIPKRTAIEHHIFRVLEVCRDLLGTKGLRRPPGAARRIVRAVVPLPARRAAGRLLWKAGLRWR